MKPIGIVAIIVVTGVVVGGGVYMWQGGQNKAQQDSLNSQISTLQTQKAALQQQATNNSSSSQSTTSNIFPMPELNIQITLNSDLPDPVYSYDAARGRLSFSSKSLVAASQNSDYCPATDAPIGLINVLSQPSTNVGAADPQDGEFLVQAGGHYFYYHHSQEACGNSDTANKLQSKQSDALLLLFKTAATLK